jgi:hypothetical protein
MYEGGIIAAFISKLILCQCYRCLSDTVVENEYPVLYHNGELVTSLKMNLNKLDITKTRIMAKKKTA